MSDSKEIEEPWLACLRENIVRFNDTDGVDTLSQDEVARLDAQIAEDIANASEDLLDAHDDLSVEVETLKKELAEARHDAQLIVALARYMSLALPDNPTPSDVAAAVSEAVQAHAPWSGKNACPIYKPPDEVLDAEPPAPPDRLSVQNAGFLEGILRSYKDPK